MEMDLRQDQGAPAQAGEEGEEMFVQQLMELISLMGKGQLPEGFDLDEACKDRAFALLLKEFPVKAAVRIYLAERGALSAEKTARQRVSDEVKSRGALPRPTRSGMAAAPVHDYKNMSSAEFRALEQAFKRAARSGKRLPL